MILFLAKWHLLFFWLDHLKFSEGDKESLVKPFDEGEVKQVIMDMKADSTCGPNGFNVTLFKTFWEVIKEEILCMFQDYSNGMLDIKRLN